MLKQSEMIIFVKINKKFADKCCKAQFTLIFLISDLMMNLKNFKVMPSNNEITEIDVSKALLTPGRLHYPKVAKKSKLDELLTRRTHLKTIEERALAAKKVCGSHKYF